ncbi:MAG: TolC family protein [Rhodoferax sp.]
MTINKAMARVLLVALMGTSAAGTHALDLAQAWRAVQTADPAMVVVRAVAQGGETQREQATAIWRPQVSVSVGAGMAGADSAITDAHFAAPGLGASNGVDFNTSVNSGVSTRWLVSMRQALHSGERSAQARQLGLSADIAQVQSNNALRDLMLLTARRYIDLLVAQNHVDLLRQQQVAVNRVLVEAQDRFALGDRPVTETYEARARAMVLQAQLLSAENTRSVAKRVLAQSTGLPEAELTLDAPSSTAGADFSEARSVEQWLTMALENNGALRLQAMRVQSAQVEVSKYGVGASSTLELVAQVGQERVSGDGDFGAATNSSGQRMVGLQWSMPVFTGGMRDARQQQALYLQDQAQAELEAARQQTGQTVQQLWLTLQTGPARLRAMQAAHQASKARLEATRLGLQVGDRTTLDLLQAENDTSAAALALVQARCDLLMARLQLGVMAGALDDAQLDDLNTAWFH